MPNAVCLKFTFSKSVAAHVCHLNVLAVSSHTRSSTRRTNGNGCGACGERKSCSQQMAIKQLRFGWLFCGKILRIFILFSIEVLPYNVSALPAADLISFARCKTKQQLNFINKMHIIPCINIAMGTECANINWSCSQRTHLSFAHHITQYPCR